MEKIDMKIRNISGQQCSKTRTHALTTLLSLTSSLLIILISITSCSDVPYSGSVLTAGHVDDYLNTIEQDTVCLQDGFDTVCVKLLLDKTDLDATDIAYTPTVHVHPTNIVYVFEYQGHPILEVKRLMDTTQIVQELVAAGSAQLPADVDNPNNGNQNYAPEGWVVQIYYPNTFREANRGRTPHTSGLDIRVVEGTIIPMNRRSDLDIIDFTQIDRHDGRRGVEFLLDTRAPKIAIQVVGVVPGNTATFHINANSAESDDSTNILRLRPL